MFPDFKKNKKILYIIINIILILTFGFCYWIIDVLSHKYKFFSKFFNKIDKKKPHNTLSYYLWFSLMTQTTVGYRGMKNYENIELEFNKQFNIIKIINTIQLVTIILVPLILI